MEQVREADPSIVSRFSTPAQQRALQLVTPYSTPPTPVAAQGTRASDEQIKKLTLQEAFEMAGNEASAEYDSENGKGIIFYSADTTILGWPATVVWWFTEDETVDSDGECIADEHWDWSYRSLSHICVEMDYSRYTITRNGVGEGW